MGTTIAQFILCTLLATLAAFIGGHFLIGLFGLFLVYVQLKIVGE